MKLNWVQWLGLVLLVVGCSLFAYQKYISPAQTTPAAEPGGQPSPAASPAAPSTGPATVPATQPAR